MARAGPRKVSRYGDQFKATAEKLWQGPMAAETLPGRMTMTQRKSLAKHFAVCINNRGYPASLELHKIYRVLPDKEAGGDGDIREIDESGENYLYSASRFVEVDLPQTIRRSLLHRT